MRARLLRAQVASQHQAFAASGINLATGACYQQVHMPRSSFDDTRGAALIDTYATASSRPGIASQSKAPALYLAFGAAGARGDSRRPPVILRPAPPPSLPEQLHHRRPGSAVPAC